MRDNYYKKKLVLGWTKLAVKFEVEAVTEAVRFSWLVVVVRISFLHGIRVAGLVLVLVFFNWNAEQKQCLSYDYCQRKVVPWGCCAYPCCP